MESSRGGHTHTHTQHIDHKEKERQEDGDRGKEGGGKKGGGKEGGAEGRRDDGGRRSVLGLREAPGERDFYPALLALLPAIFPSPHHIHILP